MKLDERTLRLIAVGASIAANCQSCLQTNLSEARACGALEAEIEEAIWVGRKIRSGAAAKMDKFAEGLRPEVIQTAGAAKDGCGCGS